MAAVAGVGRGGLMMLAWAMRHPDKTQAFVGIYPVCNLATWPLKNKPVTLADYDLSEAELRENFDLAYHLKHVNTIFERVFESKS